MTGRTAEPRRWLPAPRASRLAPVGRRAESLGPPVGRRAESPGPPVGRPPSRLGGPDAALPISRGAGLAGGALADLATQALGAVILVGTGPAIGWGSG
jgi:hypothetical protein